MKTFSLKIALFLCSFALFSCSKSKNTTTTTTTTPPPSCYVQQANEANGIVYHFHYDTGFNLIALSQYDTLGHKMDSMSIQYNANGKVSGARSYGTTIKTIRSSIAISYNRAGQDSLYFYNNDSSAAVDYYYIYNFNANGQISGGTKYTGNLSGGSAINTYGIKYDNNGNINDIQVFNYQGNLSDHSTMTYDAHTTQWTNLPMAVRLMLGNGLPSSKSNTFLNNNNVLTINDFGFGSSLLTTASYSYKYNSNGLPVSYVYSYPGLKSKNGSMTYTCK